MPSFSPISLTRLAQADERLSKLFHKVVETHDCSVLCAYRPQNEQDAAFKSGHSKDEWPHSKHNSQPSLALDVAPYPINWSDTKGFMEFAQFVLATANEMGIKIRWGGDWNGNGKVCDDKFKDLSHFEVEA